jgi:hypothetical protein
LIGAGDLEVTSSDIWVLDVASIPPKVVRLTLDGKIISIHDLPKGLWLEDGLSGIDLGSDGSVLIERIGGHAITQFVSSEGEIKLNILKGYDFQGKLFSAYPADMREKDASQGYILAGEKRIDVTVANDLGGLSILHVNPDKSFYVNVVELVLNKSFQVDQKVYHYNADGKLLGMARIPLEEQYIPVGHGIVVGPDSQVYALITKPDGAEVQRLSFFTELPAILQPPVEKERSQQLEELSITAETCRDRETIIDVAEEYLNNSIYISSYHINDNGACLGRVKPSYLGSAGTYSSVPYAWNLWDTVDQFNAFMSGGNNGYFAGNASDTYKSCGRGIDCSGLVSRAWDLGSHYGTCSLEDANISIALTSRYALRRGDIMNRCSSTPRHSIIFDDFENDGMWGHEATTEFDHDRVVRIYRAFTTIANYTPRRYKDVCSKIRLPLINKTEMEMAASNSSPNPYPPPDSSLLGTPYPPPYP